MTDRPVSVIVNTCNRAESLGRTLDALRWMDYDNFEVIVVNGPSTDGTEALLECWSDRIRVGSCPERNLSASRNIGVRMAGGDIVAFIDDDAYPDPRWLNALTAAYDDPEVAAAGGPTFDHTGYSIQAWRSYANRLGDARWELTHGSDTSSYYATPRSDTFLYTMGTNCSFRRDLLVSIGGFDEEIRYYAEETDVCVRLLDVGYVIATLDEGFIYHKFLPSDMRRRADAINDWSQIIKSRLYFALKHGVPARSFADVCVSVAAFVKETRDRVEEDVAQGRLGFADLEKFEYDLRIASNLALTRYSSGTTGERTPAWFSPEGLFRPFPTHRPTPRKLHLCIISQDYPPGPMHGIARIQHTVATSLAERGHVVQILTRGSGHNRVDFEDGVWVHRMVVEPHPNRSGLASPPFIWDSAATMLDEIRRIDAMRAVDAVLAPNWDAEGVAVLADQAFPLVVQLFTPLQVLVRVDVEAAGRPLDTYVTQLLELERYCYQHADAFLASTHTIVEQIETDYRVTLPSSHTGMVSHGLPDLTSPDDPLAHTDVGVPVRFLFVGRLEARKGIDILLDAFAKLVRSGADVELVAVGDDAVIMPDGSTARHGFEMQYPEVVPRVVFRGRVDDDELLSEYRRCDVVVAPSRFESFGLMLVEAMMFAKPVICASVGAMPLVVNDGYTGLVVPAEDTAALEDAMSKLAVSPDLRRRMGNAGRQSYEERYRAKEMAAGIETFLNELVAIRSREAVR
jgi:glycogen synthase